MVKALSITITAAPIALALLCPTSTAAYSTGTIHRPHYRLDDAFFQQQQEPSSNDPNSNHQQQDDDSDDDDDDSSSSNIRPNIPPWLNHSASDAPSSMAALQTALESSSCNSCNLSLNEREDVLKAVHMASNHDPHKLTGSADFLVGILSNLELLGRDALIAAAFHYCSCVTVRERYGYSMEELTQHEKLADEAYRTVLEGSGVEAFGSACLQIALSAARMKRAEVLAIDNACDEGGLRNLRNLLLSVTEDWRALAIRSYASLYRLQACLKQFQNSDSKLKNSKIQNEIKIQKMAKEALRVYAPLSQRLGFYILKSSLEDCAFHILYPRQYRHISQILQRKREGLHAVYESATEHVKRILSEDVDFMAQIDSLEITARIKEPYSMWRKILKTGTLSSGMDDLPDAVAMRIVLSSSSTAGTAQTTQTAQTKGEHTGQGHTDDNNDNNEEEAMIRAKERALCYYAQELCMQRYPAVSGRIKDYIRSPKKNGYQSLHCTANMRWHGEEWPFEIQIRSQEMHRVAEYGVAAHWDYKMQQQQAVVTSSSSSSSHPYPTTHMSSVYHNHNHFGRMQMIAYKNPFETQQMDETPPTRLAPYLQAMSTEHRDQARDHVFVFLREDANGVVCDDGNANGDQHTHTHTTGNGNGNGRILSLPAGACVIDALRQEGDYTSNLDLWSDILETNIYRNGDSLKSMTERLSNGDVLTVPSTCSVFA